MNGNTIKIVAVVAVIALVAGGIGIAMYMNKPTERPDITIESALEVYGNADNDYKIDENDKTVIQKIIDKEDGYTKEKYPLADADYSGEVDEEDIAVVEKIIKGEKTLVRHINHTTDTTKYPTGTYVAKTQWPVKKFIGSGGANTLLVYELVGVRDKIAAINYADSSPPDKVLYSKYLEMPVVGDSTNYIYEGPLQKCLKDNDDVTAVIGFDNKNYLNGDKGLSESEIESEYHLDVIRIQHAAVDPDAYASALLLVGFLTQKESKAQEVAQWMADIYKEISDKTKDIEKKVRVNATSYYTYLSNRNSDYADVVVMAGGDYVLGKGAKASRYFEGTSADPAIYNTENQSDVIIALRTGSGFLKASWYDSPDNYNVANMKENLSHFSNFNAYKSGKVWHISGDMPVVARVLYSASILYPDLFSMDYANEKHQEFVDKFLGGSYKVSDLCFVYSQQQIQEMKS